MAKWVSKILGVLFVLIGSVLLIIRAPVDRYHFVMHIVLGVVSIGFGFFGSMSQAKFFCLVSGVFYLALGVGGLVLGDTTPMRWWHLGPMHLNFVDDVFHILLGAGLIAVGFLSKSRAAN